MKEIQDNLLAKSERKQAGLTHKLTMQDAELARLNRLLHEKEIELHGTKSQLAELQQKIEAVYGSLSWRITLPLRRLGIMAARLTGGKIPQTNESTETGSYTEWIDRYDHLRDSDVSAIKQHMAGFPYRPLISIVMPFFAPSRFLDRTIESVIGQLYPGWELFIACDEERVPQLRQQIDPYRRQDSRIKVVFIKGAGEFSSLYNGALEAANGEFFALMEPDDELPVHALYMMAYELNGYREADIIYSDEDRIDAAGDRHEPQFKPDWNPDLFYSRNYLSHLSLLRTSLLKDVDGFRPASGATPDYDLLLRCQGKIQPERIRHISHILYHRRNLSRLATVTGKDQDESTLEAGRRALNDYFKEAEPASNVEDGLLAGTYRCRHPLPATAPLVSLIVPTRDCCKILRRCIESIFEKTTYPNYGLIIVDNGSRERETLSYLQELDERDSVNVLRYGGPFNYSAINNFAVRQARGAIVGLINNDVEVITPDWLHEMVSHAMRPDIGAVGAKLYYPDDRVQHGGVILGLRGMACHSHRYFPRNHPGYFNRLMVVQNYSAVTAACLVVRKEIYQSLGGLDEDNLPVAFNDVDFCLRVREAGYRNLWTPYAELYHHESISRGDEDTPEKQARFEREIAYFHRRWGHRLYLDPCYNPNLTLERTDFSLAWPPRITKPWIKSFQ